MNILEDESTYYFNHLYSCTEASNLKMLIRCYGHDSIEIDITNLHFQRERFYRYKHLLIGLSVFVAHWLLVIEANFLINAALLAWLLVVLLKMLSIVKCERLMFCRDFGLHLQTEYLGSRCTNLFISSASIYDVVINEVIENLDVHYILIVRTKGSLVDRQPIIPIFDKINPSVDCLETVYLKLNKFLYS